MKLVASLTAAAALTLAGGVAVAQDASGAALVDFVFSELEKEFGISPASRQIGRLAAPGSMTGTFNVVPNANYIAIGACDENCTDLDLVIRDASGNEVGSDYEPDDAPMVVIPAGSGGRYTFEVQMATCSSNCNWGVRTYNAGN